MSKGFSSFPSGQLYCFDFRNKTNLVQFSEVLFPAAASFFQSAQFQRVYSEQREEEKSQGQGKKE